MKVKISQCLYKEPEHAVALVLCELHKDDIVTLHEECVWIESVDDHDIVEVLRSWLVSFDGKWGWVSTYDSPTPAGLETIFDFAT